MASTMIAFCDGYNDSSLCRPDKGVVHGEQYIECLCDPRLEHIAADCNFTDTPLGADGKGFVPVRCEFRQVACISFRSNNTGFFIAYGDKKERGEFTRSPLKTKLCMQQWCFFISFDGPVCPPPLRGWYHRPLPIRGLVLRVAHPLRLRCRERHPRSYPTARRWWSSA